VVPEPVTDPMTDAAAGGLPDPAAGSGFAVPPDLRGRSADKEPVQLRRVGAGGTMAPDNAFAVALLTLWHEVAGSGGAVGFPPDVARSTVGSAIAPVMDALKSGRSFALALAQHRHVVGFALLDRGALDQAHTATMSLVMVQSARQGSGHGTDLVRGLFDVAAGIGIERIKVLVPTAAGLEAFFGRFGFVECGRLPGWFRTGSAPDQDGVLLVADVPAPRTAD
jgi:predicted N-acetyltransferase YhbS